MNPLTKAEIEKLLNPLTKAEIEKLLDRLENPTSRQDANKAVESAVLNFPHIARTALDALARLEDAEAAQALVVERAAEAIEATEPPFHRWLSREACANALRDLADPSGVEALAALRAERDGLKQKLISPDPYEDTAHPDDHAVNKFAAAMKGKLAAKRLQGRGGWQEPEVPNGYLSRLLREHVDKGDPVDVANFAMMIHQRGERIAPENEGASCKAIDKAETERDDALAALAAAEGRVAALTGLPPDYGHDGLRWKIGAAMRRSIDTAHPMTGREAALYHAFRAGLVAALASVTPPADTGEGA